MEIGQFTTHYNNMALQSQQFSSYLHNSFSWNFLFCYCNLTFLQQPAKIIISLSVSVIVIGLKSYVFTYKCIYIYIFVQLYISMHIYYYISQYIYIRTWANGMQLLLLLFRKWQFSFRTRRNSEKVQQQHKQQ